MSEYQYYEFLALDRPLSAEDARWLRSLSSRATITATSLTNVYHWGNFKGDPIKMLRRCFDAHVYTSNFGCRRFMLKLPPRTIDSRAAKAYRGQFGLELHPFKDCDIIEFCVEEEADMWEPEGDDGPGWMGSLAPLRNELIAGDSRSLYLAWLLGVQNDRLKPNAKEPPVPAGLQTLSAPCEALVSFLNIDKTLLCAAATQSAPLVPTARVEEDWRAFVSGLSASERDEILLRLLMNDQPAMRRELQRQLQSKESATSKQRQISGARTVGELTSDWEKRVSIAEHRAPGRPVKRSER